MLSTYPTPCHGTCETYFPFSPKMSTSPSLMRSGNLGYFCTAKQPIETLCQYHDPPSGLHTCPLTLYSEPSVAIPHPSSRMPCLDTIAAIPQALRRAARVPINCASLVKRGDAGTPVSFVRSAGKSSSRSRAPLEELPLFDGRVQ